MAVEQSRFDQSLPYAASKCKEFEGCSMPADCKGENIDIEGRKGSYGRHEDCRMLDQLSAGSPPPFGDGKVSDDSSDEYCGHVRLILSPFLPPPLFSLFVNFQLPLLQIKELHTIIYYHYKL